MREIRNLVAHDQLCPALHTCQCELCDPYCACDILAQARAEGAADEREQAAQRVATATGGHTGAIAAARGEDQP